MNWNLRTRAGVTAVLAASVLALSGGIGAYAQPAAAPAASAAPLKAEPAAAPAAPAAAGDLDQPKIAIVEAGAEPRRELRFKPDAGDEFGVRFTRKSVEEVKGAVGEQSISGPGVTIAYLAKVGDVKTDSFGTVYELLSASVDPAGGNEMGRANASQMVAVMESVKGMKVSVSSTPRGLLVSQNVSAPAGAPAGTEQMLADFADPFRQISVRLPAEPIGMGGRWTVTTKMKSSGMILTQVSTFTVKSLVEGMVSLEFTVTQSAEPQKLEATFLPPGASLELESHKASGSGVVDFDLKRPVPVKQTFKTDVASKILMKGGEQPMDMMLNVTAEETIETTPKAAVMPKAEPATPAVPATPSAAPAK